ncbi:hypothetical protein PUN28_002318 [Cardiocondyla obscurior]|uniref:Uncharacterized protein n=1 Tax=Cardiocondyla obscurior TaxID=286306 RepID=A0AAW2GTF8_9HYME
MRPANCSHRIAQIQLNLLFARKFYCLLNDLFEKNFILRFSYLKVLTNENYSDELQVNDGFLSIVFSRNFSQDAHKVTLRSLPREFIGGKPSTIQGEINFDSAASLNKEKKKRKFSETVFRNFKCIAKYDNIFG